MNRRNAVRGMSRWEILTVAVVMGSFFLWPVQGMADSSHSPVSAIVKKILPPKKTQQTKQLRIKKAPGEKTFEGRLRSIDLSKHPMTVTAVFAQGTRCETVFGGDLIPSTTVFKQGKTVGVKALGPGDRVQIFYRRTRHSLLVEKIRIFS